MNGAKVDGTQLFDPDERHTKRHFYADFEPALACLCYALCSITLSLFNKLVFSGHSFNFPISVLAFQSLCAVVFLIASDWLKLSEPSPLTRGTRLAGHDPLTQRRFDKHASDAPALMGLSTWRAHADVLRAMAPVTLLFCLMLWTSGKALRYVSMPIFTVFKNLAVVGTTTWEYFRFGSRVSVWIIFSLLLMVAGSVVAGAGDLTATREGFLWMLVNVVMTVAYVASLKELVPPDLPSSVKTLANNMLSLVVFVGVAATNGEIGAFWVALMAQSRLFKLALLCTGVIGTAINMSTFWCARVTSGATYAFVGASNKIPVALIGHFAFHSELTVGGWIGVTLGLGSGIIFAITKERERRQSATARNGTISSLPQAPYEAITRKESGAVRPDDLEERVVEKDDDDDDLETAPLRESTSGGRCGPTSRIV